MLQGSCVYCASAKLLSMEVLPAIAKLAGSGMWQQAEHAKGAGRRKFHGPLR